MKLRIVAVGRCKDAYFADAVAEYVKRAGRFAPVSVIEVPDCKIKESAGAETVALEREADAILPLLEGRVIALDIDGTQYSSPAFARLLGDTLAVSPVVTFAIGGSFGLSPRVKERADLRLSFGKATFPHLLARVMLAEQLYRALTILNNHPYHK